MKITLNAEKDVGFKCLKTGIYELTEEIFLNVKAENNTEENLDKNEILKIIGAYIEGTERFKDKSNSNKSTKMRTSKCNKRTRVTIPTMKM